MKSSMTELEQPLDAAADSPEYWTVLNEIVTRIQKERQHE